jgi:hypothetical protein
MSSKNPKENAKEAIGDRGKLSLILTNSRIIKDPKLDILEILNFLELKIPNTATKMKGR